MGVQLLVECCWDVAFAVQISDKLVIMSSFDFDVQFSNLVADGVKAALGDVKDVEDFEQLVLVRRKCA